MLPSTGLAESDPQSFHYGALLAPPSHGRGGFRSNSQLQRTSSPTDRSSCEASLGESAPGWFADDHPGQGTQRDQMGIKSSSTPPTPHDAPLATACAPTPYPWRSWANVPSRAVGGRHFCMASSHKLVAKQTAPVGVPRAAVVATARTSLPGHRARDAGGLDS